VRQLVETLRPLVKEVVPGVSEKAQPAWKTLNFDHQGGLIALGGHARWATLAFVRGVELDDPEGRLSGTGVAMRNLRLEPGGGPLPREYLVGLIRQAAALNQASGPPSTVRRPRRRPRPAGGPRRRGARPPAELVRGRSCGQRSTWRRARLEGVLHLSYFRGAMGPVETSFQAALRAVSPAVGTAAREASRRLGELGIRHALVGGLAVAAHGAPRNTTDVDFLVGLEAFEGSGLVLTHRQGVPVKVAQVAVDLLPAEEPSLERALDEAMAAARDTGDPPVIGLPVLVQMKLRALRPHDQDDVRRLIQAGADLGALRAHLAAAEPALLSRLDYVLSRA
jgi:hypothetical protein